MMMFFLYFDEPTQFGGWSYKSTSVILSVCVVFLVYFQNGSKDLLKFLHDGRGKFEPDVFFEKILNLVL